MDSANFPTDSLSHEVVRNGTGGGLAVAIHSSSGKYSILVSPDTGGTSWTTLDEQQSNTRPALDIAIDSQDDLFAVWRTTTSINFTAYNWFGTQSSTDWALNVPAENFTVTADQDDRAHVAGVSNGDIYYTNCTIDPSGSSCVGDRTIATGMYNMTAIGVNGTNHTLIAAKNSTGWIKLVEETATGWQVTDLASNADAKPISFAVTRQANGPSEPWIVYTDASDDLWAVNDTGNEQEVVTGFVENPSIATNNGTQLYVTYENTSSNNIQLVKEEGCGWVGPITLHSGTYSNPSTKFQFYNNHNASTVLDYLFYDAGASDVLYSNLTLDQSCTFTFSEQFVADDAVISRNTVLKRLLSQPLALQQQLARLATGGRSITASFAVVLDDDRTGTVSRLFSQGVVASLQELRTFGAGRLSLQPLGLASVLTRSQVLGRVLDQPFAFDLTAARKLVLDRLVTGSVAVDQAITVRQGFVKVLDQAIAVDLTLGQRSQVLGRTLDTLVAFDEVVSRTGVLGRSFDTGVAVGDVVAVTRLPSRLASQVIGYGAVLERRSVVLGRVTEAVFAADGVFDRRFVGSRLLDQAVGVADAVAVTRLPLREAVQAVGFDVVLPVRGFTGGRTLDTLYTTVFAPSRSNDVGRFVESRFVFDDVVSQSLHVRKMVAVSPVVGTVVTRTYDGIRMLVTAVDIEDIVSRGFVGSKLVATPYDVVDAFSTEGSRLLSIDQRIAVLDAVDRAAALGRSDAVGIAVGDVLDRSQVLGRVLATAVAVDAPVARLGEVGRRVRQAIGAGDEVARLVSLGRGVDEGLSVFDGVERLFTGGRTVGDGIGVAAAVSRIAVLDRLALFDVGYDAVAVRGLSLGRGVDAAVGLDTGIDRLVAGGRTIEEALNAGVTIQSFDTMFRGIGTPVGFTGLVGRQGTFDRLRSFGLGYDAVASRLVDGGRGVAAVFDVDGVTSRIRSLDRVAVLRAAFGTAVERGLVLQRVRDTGIEVVLAPFRGVVTARGVGDRFGVTPLSGRLFDGFRGAEAAVGVADGIAVRRGLFRAVDAPVGYALFPSRGFTGGRVLDQVYQVTPQVARQLVLSRLPSRNVTVVTEENAIDERLERGALVSGSVTDTRSDDGIVKEMEEQPWADGDQLRAFEVFETNLNPEEVTKLTFGTNAWTGGEDAEAFDVSIYNTEGNGWMKTFVSIDSTDSASEYMMTVCESGCTLNQTPSEFINGTGHIRFRYTDSVNDDTMTSLNVDYQAVNLSRNVVRHDFGIGFGADTGALKTVPRSVGQGIGFRQAVMQHRLLSEVVAMDIGLEGSVSRLVDRSVGVDQVLGIGDMVGRDIGRSVLLDTSIAVAGTFDRAVQYDRMVNMVVGFFDWLAKLFEAAPEDDDGGDGGDGGGGTGDGGFGGGGTTEPAPEPVPGLAVLSDGVTLRVRAGATDEFVVRFRNNGTGNGTYNLDVREIQEFVRPDVASYRLGPNQTEEAEFAVAVPANTSSAVYGGGVGIGVAALNRTVPVDIVVPTPDREERLAVDLELEDANITDSGGSLSLDVFNLGNRSVQANVTITITNATGHVVRRETRRTDVQTALSLRNRFGQDLAAGKYTMEVAVAYGNRTETASSSFRVAERRQVEEPPADGVDIPWTLLRRAAAVMLALLALGLVLVGGRRLWRRHVAGREAEKLVCEHCGREFSSPELYRIHRNRHKAAGVIGAYLAGRSADAGSGSAGSSGGSSTQEVEVEHEHECPVCGETFDSEHGLHVHQGLKDHYLE